MQTLTDVHQQFASFFKSEALKPYAFLVSRRLGEGHICLPLEDVEQEMEKLPPNFHKIRMSEQELLAEAQVALDSEPKQPFILFNKRLYMQRYFNYETIIVERIREFIAREGEFSATRIDELKKHRGIISELFCGRDGAATETDWQLVAALTAALSNFCIITGGPGTGKTTTVARLLALLFNLNSNLKVALAAPTGKAALRMAESLKSSAVAMEETIAASFQSLQPLTLHRLLRFVPDSPYFQHNRTNPLNYDVIVVDEASMADVALFAKLMDAIGPGTRLILLGDKDQLASVEAGSLFGDLCQAQAQLNVFSLERADFLNSFIDKAEQKITLKNVKQPNGNLLFQHVIELQYSHRFAGNQGIGRFSRAVLHNDQVTLAEFAETNVNGQVQLDPDYDNKVFETFISAYAEYIREPDIKAALAKLGKLRILCALREGPHGLYAVNRNVEKFLIQRKLIRLSGEFYEHRPVIITRNNYTLKLFNGDVGIIRKDKNGALKAWFENSEGELFDIYPGLIQHAETVYAMTIHKSQGSEFDRVLIILPAADNAAVLNRQLLYTAVTRAKTQVILQAAATVIAQAAAHQVDRASGIAERLSDAGNE